MLTRIRRRMVLVCLVWAVMALSLRASDDVRGNDVRGNDVRDDEAATHADGAAKYQLVDSYAFTGFTIDQYDLAVLSHFSYMLYSGDECLVVDPGRDIDTYINAAESKGAKIVAVWLTHSHADFVAGHVEFAERLQVPLHISEKANAGYEHVSLNDGDTARVGDAIVTFLETPGHTPDSMCGVVANRAAPKSPLALLTGDTLFVGSVGRPDLLGEGMAASTLASMMYDTWTKKLSKLPDNVMILPAHGAGSLCGAHLSDDPVSTIGEQRSSNAYLQYTNRGEFVAAILGGLPQAPQYFAHNAAINRDGPELVEWNMPDLPLVEPSAELTDPDKYYVVDVREAQDYAESHIPNSVNIALRGRFETWTGIMVPWESRTVVTGSEEDIREALHRLNRVGYKAQGIPFAAWAQAGLPTSKNAMLTPPQLYQQMQSAESPVVVDVRLPKEWMAQRIGTVLNIPLTELSEQWIKIDRSQRVVAVCNSAYRSSLAVGILERNGFEHASSLAGGGEAWVEAGLPVYGPTTPSFASNSAAEMRLAERVSATELSQLALHFPDTFQLIDIRPADQFADFHLTGAENVALADALSNPVYSSGTGPLIVVDRDGSMSMMVAGILSQKTDRPVKALSGGLQSYWNEVGIGAAARSTAPVVLQPGPIPVRPTTVPATPQKPKKKRRSAGC